MLFEFVVRLRRQRVRLMMEQQWLDAAHLTATAREETSRLIVTFDVPGKLQDVDTSATVTEQSHGGIVCELDIQDGRVRRVTITGDVA